MFLPFVVLCLVGSVFTCYPGAPQGYAQHLRDMYNLNDLNALDNGPFKKTEFVDNKGVSSFLYFFSLCLYFALLFIYNSYSDLVWRMRLIIIKFKIRVASVGNLMLIN